MKKIDTLTEAQTARIPEFRDKWLKIGLSTERANRSAAEQSVRDAYKEGGLEAPKFLVWVDSPRGGLIAANLVKEFLAKYPAEGGENSGEKVRGQVRDQVGDQVWDQVVDQVGDQVRDQVRGQVWDQVWDQVRDQVVDQVGDQVRDQVRDQVGDQVRDQVWDQVRDQVWDQVRGQVRDQVGDQVWDQVVDQVGDQVRDQVGDQVGGQVWDQVWENFSSLRSEWDDLWFWGSHDAGWLSFYDYFKEVCGLEVCKRLDPLMRLSQESGWVWMYRGFAILTERPTQLHRNAEHRIHNESGPAIGYADGYAVYAVNGTRCPEKLIMTPRADLDVKEWLKCENVDHRRVAFEKIGLDRVTKDLGAVVVDHYECPVGGPYDLLEIDVGVDEKKKVLSMLNPSIKDRHIEGVPPSTKTVKEALAFRNGQKTYQAPAHLS